MKHNFRRLAAIVLTAAALFSFTAVAAQIGSGAGSSPMATAAGGGNTPLVAYSLKDNDFKDKSGNNNPDIELDYEDEKDPESRKDEDR